MEKENIPSCLKRSYITPIHKGGSLASPVNYIPVSLTSHIIKIFEKVLRNNIGSFFKENNLYNPSQHGCRSGRSCLSQLIEHLDNVLSLLEKGENVDVVYLDFSKAFDKVDFKVALNKIN